ncbi:hypothetical protein Tco_1369307 [Tanacetum coccineum]
MEITPTNLEGVDQRVTELDTTIRQKTEEFQVRFEEAYDDRAYLRARVNTLFRDRPYHRHTSLALDREVVYARIAWTGFKERSATIEAHVRTLEAQVATLIAQTTSLQTQLTIALGRQLSAALGQIQALQARDQTHADDHEGAASTVTICLQKVLCILQGLVAIVVARAVDAAGCVDTPMKNCCSLEHNQSYGVLRNLINMKLFEIALLVMAMEKKGGPILTLE